MYTQEFAADPHAAYRRMRDEHGGLVPVELFPGFNATLVVNHATALRILNDPVNFPADPRKWQQSVPADCPILPMVGYRENALRSAGREHARYRASNVDALRGVALHGMEWAVRRAARQAISSFCERGKPISCANSQGRSSSGRSVGWREPQSLWPTGSAAPCRRSSRAVPMPSRPTACSWRRCRSSSTSNVPGPGTISSPG